MLFHLVFGTLCCILKQLSVIETTEIFTVYRAQQFDVQGSPIGSRLTSVDCEAQTHHFRLVSRRCLLVSLSDISVDLINKAIFHNLAGIIIGLPSHEWSVSLKQHFSTLENEIFSSEFRMPIYFVLETKKLITMMNKLEQTSGDQNFALSKLWSDGYLINVRSSAPKTMENLRLFNIEGRVSAAVGSKRPTIVICAHYDSISAIPALSYGADANGSGLVALLELARIFADLFASSTTQAKYDLLFLVTAGGTVNYLGAKRWLDQQIDDSDGLVLIDSIAHVICLEGIGSNDFGSDLYIHSSKFPKDGSFSFDFLQSLRINHMLDSDLPNITDAHNKVHWVHKKINLNKVSLDWEHERFSIYRLSGLTLSSWPTLEVANQFRRSSLDGGPLRRDTSKNGIYGDVDPAILSRNIAKLANALARIVFGSENDTELNFPLIDQAWVSESTVTPLLDLVLNQPRSVQLLHQDTKLSPKKHRETSKDDKFDYGLPKFLRSLHYLLMDRILDVRITDQLLSDSLQTNKDINKPTSRSTVSTSVDDEQINMQSNPPSLVFSAAAASSGIDIVFYSGTEPAQLVINELKSSIFDLLVAIAIGAYLGILYFLLEYSRYILELVYRSVNLRKVQ